MIKIKIDKIDQAKTEFGTKITLVSGKLKYIFYSTVKSGEKSKAYSQFKDADWGVGDEIMAEVAEEEKTFKGDDGNSVKYIERRIMFFSTENGGQTPSQEANNGSKMTLQPVSASKPINMPSAEKEPLKGDLQVLARIDGLEKRMTEVEGEINDLKNEGTPFDKI